MIRAVIVDDEELARHSLREVLAQERDIQVVAEAANGLEALEVIAEHQPDVVFLDIEMPGLTGIEVLNNLNAPPLVVFVTAYDEYAVRAFEASAIDYVLKPLQSERIHKSLDRVRTALEQGRQSDVASLHKLLAELRPSLVHKIAARKGKRIVLLSPKEILRATVEDKLVFLETATERYMTDKNLSGIEELLQPAGFFRISRADLVNLEYAREIIPWFSGTYKLKLTTGQELDVSRDRARRLKELMNL